MNEIEKMFENAGVEKCNNSLKDIIHNVCPKNNKDENYKCEDCEYNWYPEFTAEKQLELIKFLFNHNVYYDVDEKGNYWFHITDDCYTYYYNKFEIALANIINEMWQDLTEEERKQIKEILR